MNKIVYSVGDLIMAEKKYDFNSPRYEWWPVNADYAGEYAIITKIVNLTDSEKRYYVKFIDGSEDCMHVSEFRMRASCEKISRQLAAAPHSNIKESI